MVAANLIDPERNGFVFVGILALDDQDGNAVDEKDDIFARPEPAVVDGRTPP